MPATSEKCETTGIYRGDCAAGSTAHRREIAITKGTMFPPCAQCERMMTWTLIQTPA